MWQLFITNSASITWCKGADHISAPSVRSVRGVVYRCTRARQQRHAEKRAGKAGGVWFGAFMKASEALASRSREAGERVA